MAQSLAINGFLVSDQGSLYLFSPKWIKKGSAGSKTGYHSLDNLKMISGNAINISPKVINGKTIRSHEDGSVDLTNVKLKPLNLQVEVTTGLRVNPSRDARFVRGALVVQKTTPISIRFTDMQGRILKKMRPMKVSPGKYSLREELKGLPGGRYIAIVIRDGQGDGVSTDFRRGKGVR